MNQTFQRCAHILLLIAIMVGSLAADPGPSIQWWRDKALTLQKGKATVRIPTEKYVTLLDTLDQQIGSGLFLGIQDGHIVLHNSGSPGIDIAQVGKITLGPKGHVSKYLVTGIGMTTVYFASGALLIRFFMGIFGAYIPFAEPLPTYPEFIARFLTKTAGGIVVVGSSYGAFSATIDYSLMREYVIGEGQWEIVP